MKNKLLRVVSTTLGGVLTLTAFASLAGCKKGGGSKKDSIVIMTEELSGLFNPFYATSGTDMDVVGMTQIGMLSTDKNGQPVAGDDQPTVVKAFKQETNNSGTDNEETVYTFVLKNGLKFSNGSPLTMNDVMFNMYEYLDPVYTGSSTMYSIDIKGLTEYRTQSNYAGDLGEEMYAQLVQQAAALAEMRLYELQMVFELNGRKDGSDSYSMTEAEMEAAINAHEVSDGFKNAVATTAQQEEWEEAGTADEKYRAQLLADYKLALKTHKEELEADFKAAKESFDLTTAPYKDHKDLFSNDIFKFFYYEGKIKGIPPTGEDGKKDKSKIERFEYDVEWKSYDTQEKAINKLYEENTVYKLHQVVSMWGTAGTLRTQFSADAIDVLLHNNMEGEGVKNISGIVSLGHTTNTSKVTIDGVDYPVAQDHEADGTVKQSAGAAEAFDVLQITINGTDPKAIYNFGFTVAPAYYYGSAKGDGSDVDIDIKDNKFGVKFADSKFQSNVIQSQRNVEVPVGAGAFMATNEDNGNSPSGSDFWKSNIVYFKANPHFMFNVKAQKLRMQVISSTNAIDKLANGEVDYITPQLTPTNSERLTGMEKKGFTQLSSWQLGYGYIGINAGKVPNVNIRRAIMSAMQQSIAIEYYVSGTCKTISWPMSMESWAYPWTDKKYGGEYYNEHEYTYWGDGDTDMGSDKDEAGRAEKAADLAAAKDKIASYMRAAGVEAGDSQLSIKFTIAGASITEHPTYGVFKQAAEILNDMGWDVEVKADSQALTKLSTGSLAVWAAAWGSTIDPDMYQVYHKNSSATSVYAWGYREIKANTTLYAYENGVINQLSDIIDDARSITDQPTRTEMYRNAMKLVLDLAVEMPVYQRKTLYAYNNKTIKGLTSEVNPYTSPLEKIWELELVK